LSPDEYEWRWASGFRAIPCIVYTQSTYGIGRATIAGETVVGKIDLKNHQFEAPYNGKVYAKRFYEALLHKSWCGNEIN